MIISFFKPWYWTMNKEEHDKQDFLSDIVTRQCNYILNSDNHAYFLQWDSFKISLQGISVCIRLENGNLHNDNPTIIEVNPSNVFVLHFLYDSKSLQRPRWPIFSQLKSEKDCKYFIFQYPQPKPLCFQEMHLSWKRRKKLI